MAKTKPFDKFSKEYEEWFVKNEKIYKEELKAIKSVLPPFQKGVEIGVGSGRFAKPLGIKIGVEPSLEMAKIAKERGIEIIKGEAENLPFLDESFDFALMVTTICFVDDPLKSLKEVFRILKSGGFFIVAFVDKDSLLGKFYLANKDKSRFYKEARFFSAKEVEGLLKEAGFTDCIAKETLFGDRLKSLKGGIKDGYGNGAFVVFRCRKE